MKLFTFLSLATLMLSTAHDYAISAPIKSKIPAWCNPSEGPMNGWLNFFKIRKWCKSNGFSEFGRYKALSFRHKNKGNNILIFDIDNICHSNNTKLNLRFLV